MSQQDFAVRKIHREGAQRVSRGMTIPMKFLKELDIETGSYVKIYMGEKGAKRIWIEKVEE